jgi:hypothetical protein
MKQCEDYKKQPAILARAQDLWDSVAEYFNVIFASVEDKKLPFKRTVKATLAKGKLLLKKFSDHAGAVAVTPYWHILCVHVPQMMVRFPMFFFFQFQLFLRIETG